MKSENDSIAARLIDATRDLADLDSAQSFFVSNNLMDNCPPLQRAMLLLLQTERIRREGTEIAGYALPEFHLWETGDLLKAGMGVICCCEAAAMAGDPSLSNFGFRLLQFWFVGCAKTAEVQAP